MPPLIAGEASGDYVGLGQRSAILTRLKVLSSASELLSLGDRDAVLLREDARLPEAHRGLTVKTQTCLVGKGTGPRASETSRHEQAPIVGIPARPTEHAREPADMNQAGDTGTLAEMPDGNFEPRRARGASGANRRVSRGHLRRDAESGAWRPLSNC